MKRGFSLVFRPIRLSGLDTPVIRGSFSCNCSLRHRKFQSWEQIGWTLYVGGDVLSNYCCHGNKMTHAEWFFDKALGQGAARHPASTFLLEQWEINKYCTDTSPSLAWLFVDYAAKWSSTNFHFIIHTVTYLWKVLSINGPHTPTLVFYLNVAD